MTEKMQVEGASYAVAPVSYFQPITQLPRMVESVIEKGTVYSTYDLNDPKNRGAVYDQMVEGGQPADKFIGQEFAIKHITVFPIRFADKQTGEEISMPLCLITTDNGDTIQFVSKGIWGSLLMMQACGYLPFGGTPQRFVLTQVSVGEGKRFYQLHRAKEKKGK